MAVSRWLVCLFLHALCACDAQAALFSEWTFNSGWPVNGIARPSTGSGFAANSGGTTNEQDEAGGGSSDPVVPDMYTSNEAWQTRGYPAQGTNNKTAGVEFSVSTIGLEDISLQYDLRHSNTSSRYEQVQYSLDGTSWIDIGVPFAGSAGDAWFNNRTIDLSAIDAADNNPDFRFRVVSAFAPSTSQYAASNSGSSYATSGSWRFDMVQLFNNALSPYVWTRTDTDAGFFNDPANWSSSQVPSSIDTAILGVSGFFGEINVDQDIETNRLLVRNWETRLSLGPHTWTTNAPSNGIVIGAGAGDFGLLQLNSGNIITRGLTLGYAERSRGTLAVVGPDSNISVIDAPVMVGLAVQDFRTSNTSELIIADGAKVTISGDGDNSLYVGIESFADVEIDGTDSTLSVGDDIVIGENNVGHVVVSNGAHINAGGSVTMVGEAASLDIRGNSVLESGPLRIGTKATSNFSSSFGVVSSIATTTIAGTDTTISTAIGTELGSYGTAGVAGEGASWIQDGIMQVGVLGQGSFAVVTGGYAECPDAEVSTSTSSQGQVRVLGANAHWAVLNRLVLGGSLSQEGGFALMQTSSNGLVTVGSLLRLGTQGEIHLYDAGMIQVGNVHTPAAPNTLQIGAGGTFAGNGKVVGNVANLSGQIAPGLSAGELSVVGNFAQADEGELLIEIGGTTPDTQFDRLSITGSVELNGKLSVSLLDLGNGPFVPEVGNVFEFLTATGGISGRFDIEALNPLTGGIEFDVVYNSNSVQLVVVVSDGLPGDYNQNGTVDAADYTIWRDHQGQNLTLTNENPAATTPGVVDAEDYAFWKAHFGDFDGSGAGANTLAAIPEPATLVLLILSATGWCVRRGRVA